MRLFAQPAGGQGKCARETNDMRNCATCKLRREDCPEGPDGALLALGPFWGGSDRDCPLELEQWRKDADAALGKR